MPPALCRASGFALGLAVLLIAIPRAHAAGRIAPESERGVHALTPRWGDGVFAAGTVAAVGAVAPRDVRIARWVEAHDSPTQQRLARWAAPLGREAVLGGAVVALGIAALSDRDALRDQVRRADLSILAAAGCTYGIKKLVGRVRPEDSPDDARAFHPFSRHDAFPSGHATLAFAAVAALDRETSSAWVPALGFPLAGLVAWSRVHDRKHWTSDVIAGAAIGFGVAWKAEDFQRGQRGAASSRGLAASSSLPQLTIHMRW